MRDWTEVGVRPRLRETLLAELRKAGLLEMAPWSEHHVIVDRHGTLLAVSVTGGNRHDVTQLIPSWTRSP
ncbi:hypothetical protein [Streptomyces sp. NPDC000410]|uniref:hypothetical protein n=1 Tax=Streptomyces sp. NPDC000410 TaxID=3154254 RepID=UPI0033252681